MNGNHLWMLVGAVVIIGMMNKPEEPDALTKEATTYCEMVQSFKETNGRMGWPDYRGTFRKVCK